MNMHFEGSSSVTLLFDFWNVHGPAGMVLSVFVVLLLTVFYELLKVWKITLGKQTQSSIMHSPAPAAFSPDHACFAPVLSSALASSPSEISLAPTENTTETAETSTASKSWLLHSLQTGVHVLQVTLGYMLMLCVMSYNVWIFLGVIVGSVLGYFIAFPLMNHV